MASQLVGDMAAPRAAGGAVAPARRRWWAMAAPLVTLGVLMVLLLEGPRLLRMTGLAGLLPQWPIEAVLVTGELRHVPRAELTEAITSSLGGDFFRVDVGTVREVALALPWVEEVAVRKVWPGKLHVQVRERIAAARWGAGGLLSASGVLFQPRDTGELAGLPALIGPPGSEARMLRRYRTLVSALAPLGMPVSTLELDPRSGWRVELGGRLQLMLGHEMDEARLERFAVRLPRLLGGRLASAQRIDLRYANGFAVGWRSAGEQGGAGLPGPRGTGTDRTGMGSTQ